MSTIDPGESFPPPFGSGPVRARRRWTAWAIVITFQPGLATQLHAQENPVQQPIYSEVVGNLLKASVPVQQLGTEGRVAVTTAAGRIVAMAFSPQGQNLLWSHPDLADTEQLRNHPDKLVGGIGGDRLWFSPELAYHWDGKPDWETFANYKPPAAADPGSYQFVKQDLQSLTLRASGELPVHGSDVRVGFEVERDIRLIDPPVASGDALMQGVDFIGIETSHRLKLADKTRTGRIALWHLLQAPAGAVLVVPLRKSADAALSTPLPYASPSPGAWVQKADHILWPYGGEARVKFGLPANVLTGRSAVFRELEPGRWSMIVRQFPVDPNALYADHPDGVPRNDQVFQAWDGFGFGEMEYHSPMLDAERGARELRETDQLWAFGGTAQAIGALARKLLGVDVAYIFKS